MCLCCLLFVWFFFNRYFSCRWFLNVKVTFQMYWQVRFLNWLHLVFTCSSWQSLFLVMPYTWCKYNTVVCSVNVEYVVSYLQSFNLQILLLRRSLHWHSIPHNLHAHIMDCLPGLSASPRIDRAWEKLSIVVFIWFHSGWASELTSRVRGAITFTGMGKKQRDGILGIPW